MISRSGLLLISARPEDWIKNGFVFSALFFSKNLLNPNLLEKTVLAFALFCLTASGVYLANDILDQKQDQTHSLKRKRPIASGALPVSIAGPCVVFIFIIALCGALLLKPAFGFVIAGYVALNLSYSKWLKHLVILDVFSIAAGFVLRVIGGAVVIDVVMSRWLLICTMLISLFLGFGKRRHEVVALANDASLHRRVLSDYDPVFLDMMIGVVTSATVIAYILYTVSSETVQRFHTDRLVLTLPFVLYGIFRYLYLVYHKNLGGAPSLALFTDKPLLLDIGLWAATSGLIIYAGTR